VQVQAAVSATVAADGGVECGGACDGRQGSLEQKQDLGCGEAERERAGDAGRVNEQRIRSDEVGAHGEIEKDMRGWESAGGGERRSAVVIVLEDGAQGERAAGAGAARCEQGVSMSEGGGESERRGGVGIREREIGCESSDAAGDGARRCGCAGGAEDVERGEVGEKAPAGEACGAPAMSGERMSEDGGAEGVDAVGMRSACPCCCGGREREAAVRDEEKVGGAGGEDEESECGVVAEDERAEGGE